MRILSFNRAVLRKTRWRRWLFLRLFTRFLVFWLKLYSVRLKLCTASAHDHWRQFNVNIGGGKNFFSKSMGGGILSSFQLFNENTKKGIFNENAKHGTPIDGPWWWQVKICAAGLVFKEPQNRRSKCLDKWYLIFQQEKQNIFIWIWLQNLLPQHNQWKQILSNVKLLFRTKIHHQFYGSRLWSELNSLMGGVLKTWP